mgnify:CR=1 FL=1|tara:strand:+ start:622550 stop:623851 length:1302 start_codon:yes stop_codon:yes gene_type:complete
MNDLAANHWQRRLPFFYGYVMIPVAMLVQICTSPGQTFAVSAFTPALRQSLQLSDSTLSLAYMLGTLLAAVPLSVIGPLSDRYGLKVVTLVAVGALASACWYASHVTGFYTLLIAFFLLRFLGQGSLSLLSGNAISMWFRTRIGRVSAVMSIGMSVAFAWVPQWLSESIVESGWRWTYQALAAIIAATMIPTVVVLFRNRPEDIGQAVDGVGRVDTRSSGSDESTKDASDVHTQVEYSLNLRQSLRSRSIYILGATTFLWAMAGTGFVFYLFDICADRGQDGQVAGDLFKTFGLTMLVLQLAGGVLADYVPLNRLLGLGSVMLAAGTASLWVASDATMLHVFAALFGGGQGLLISVGSVVWVRYYGREHLGSIRGTVWSLTVAGSGCGPLLMGVVRDRFGVFDPAIGFFGLAMTLLAVVAWWATPPTALAVEA